MVEALQENHEKTHAVRLGWGLMMTALLCILVLSAYPYFEHRKFSSVAEYSKPFDLRLEKPNYKSHYISYKFEASDGETHEVTKEWIDRYHYNKIEKKHFYPTIEYAYYEGQLIARIKGNTGMGLAILILIIGPLAFIYGLMIIKTSKFKPWVK